jgi:predicted acyl esterase
MVTARVEDVAPDGTSTQMSAGWDVISLRALDSSRTVYANGLMAQPYHPFTQASVLPVPADGSPVEVDVEIYPTGWDLVPGHTIRLALQEADAPHLTASVPLAANSAGATLSIFHDAAHDSELVIPVRGAQAAATTKKAKKTKKHRKAKRRRRRISRRPRTSAGFTG